MKTVRVRVAVQVGVNGKWAAYGWTNVTDEDASGTALDMIDETGGSEHLVWLEADVPLPEERTIEATVSAAEKSAE